MLREEHCSGRCNILGPIFGGNANSGVVCGSRSSNWNNAALNLNWNIGARGLADTWGNLKFEPREANPRLIAYALLRQNTQRGDTAASKRIRTR